MTTRATCMTQDAEDVFRDMRDQFHLPKGKIYLDGNSLGLMPLSARERVAKAVAQEWGEDLITSWNKHGWFHMPRVLGNRLSRLVGGGEDNVIVADTISINLFRLLAAALALRPDRKVILSDTGNFPSDIYVAQGLGELMGGQHELKLVEPENVISSIDTSGLPLGTQTRHGGLDQTGAQAWRAGDLGPVAQCGRNPR
jgi:kynureninase